MKSYLPILLVCIIFPHALAPQGSVERLRGRNRDALEEQQIKDRLRILRIRKEFDAFRREIQGLLGEEGDLIIDDPVDIEEITDLHRQDHIHSRKKIPPREFAYINGAKVKMRAEASLKSEIIGTLAFRERVAVLLQSERADSIKGVLARWLLVRKENRDEGWVFGAYVQSMKPDREESIDTFEKGRMLSEDFTAPLAGAITSRFGYRVHPVTKRRGAFHQGLDIAASEGTPVKASSGGIVRKAGYFRNGYGNLIVIEHDGGLCTYYGHLSAIRVKIGQRVKQGEIIGAVGKTGRATGPHLHFEVRKGETALDPEKYLR